MVTSVEAGSRASAFLPFLDFVVGKPALLKLGRQTPTVQAAVIYDSAIQVRSLREPERALVLKTLSGVIITAGYLLQWFALLRLDTTAGFLFLLRLEVGRRDTSP